MGCGACRFTSDEILGFRWQGAGRIHRPDMGGFRWKVGVAKDWRRSWLEQGGVARQGGSVIDRGWRAHAAWPTTVGV
jgi:hypothetical protein